MATWYVEVGGTGDGTAEGLAAGNIQTVIDDVALAGGDTILCKTGTHMHGTDFSAEIDLNGVVGAKATPIAIIGVNASWVEDGSIAVWDGNAAELTNGIWRIPATGMAFLSLRNIRWTMAGGSAHGLYDETGTSLVVLSNCRSDNNGGSGVFDSGAEQYKLFFGCSLDNNARSGWECTVSSSRVMPAFHRCIIHGNGRYGVEQLSKSHSTWTHTAIFANTLGGVLYQTTPNTAGAADFLVLVGCSIVENGGDAIGPLTSTAWVTLVDTIVRKHDDIGANGINANGNVPMPTTGSLAHMAHCSFTGNTANISDGALIGIGHQHSDPSFVDEDPIGGADLTPGASWAGLAAGLDLFDGSLGAQNMDIGAVQRAAAGGAARPFPIPIPNYW
jgi:hypothetical protein